MRIVYLLGITVLIIVIDISHALSHQVDSTSMSSSRKRCKTSASSLMIPAVLIGGGTIALLDKDGDEFIFNNMEIKEERFEKFRSFSTRIDDYLQHTPSVVTFALSAMGVKGKHNLKEQGKLFLESEVLMTMSVFALKSSVGEARPDTGIKNSFPSGHTAQAFMAATFVTNEFGYKSPWIAIGAYSVATSVGVMRMMNNRHWLSDVLAGAGIGMLSTGIVYRTNEHSISKKDRLVAFQPFSMAGANGFSISYLMK